MGLADEKYMLLTTFRRDGRPVATPVWLAPLDGGEIGFYTGSGTGKAKRLRHTSRVTVQACNAKGSEVHGDVYEATARLVSGAEVEPIVAAIRTKYGIVAPITRFFITVMGRLRGQDRHPGDTGVIVSLNG